MNPHNAKLSLLFVFPSLLLTVVFGIPLLIGTQTNPPLIYLGGIGTSVTVTDLLFVIGFFIAISLTALVYYYILSRSKITAVADSKIEELLKSRDFFLRLFDDSPIPYMMVDKEGMILLPNKSAQRLFNMSTQELTQFKFHQLHDGDELHFVQSRTIYDKFIRGVASLNVEMEIVQRNGTKRWVLMSALPYRVFGGEGTGGTVSMLDITDQKALNKVKTEFVSLASHQLRTPLTAMKWYGELVLNGKDILTETQRSYITKIYNANQRMIDLVNLLLSASRLELGSLKVDIKNVDPVVIVKNTLEELAPLIMRRNIHVIEHYEGDNTNYYSDLKLMRMILQNLISNAVKYNNNDGEVRISLTFTNDNLTLVISDNGLGIPEEQQDQIFTKMFRADNARLKVTDGTGLGLYIVKKACETLRGEIGFTSKVDHGTIFKAIIPNGTHGSSSKTNA